MFMGVAQILLDNLDLSELVIGWYKLFGTSSLVSVPPGGGKEPLQVKFLKTYFFCFIKSIPFKIRGSGAYPRLSS